MGSYRIAVLPGDGIGPEVTEATLAVLGRLCSLDARLSLETTGHDAGADRHRRLGVALPDEVLEDCQAADAVLLAAIGLPEVRKPDGTEVQPEMMMGLRRGLALHSAIRPVKLYPGVPGPLREVEAGIDLVIVRENNEGLFASFGGGSILDDAVATDTLVVTRAGTRRVVETAMTLAEHRSGRPLDGRRMVTCVDKANVFRTFAFFRKVFFEVAAEHPGVAADAQYVDAMSLYLVQNPAAWDVLVMENQFGDILSDLGAGIVGGLGIAPSAEIGPEHALFQPSHGSAPQIAGLGVANPLATILSAQMMLDWLGRTRGDPAASEAAARLEAAVSAALAAGTAQTKDLGGTASTRQCADAVIGQLEA